MSNAPPDSAENSAARTIRRAISGLTGTAREPASRLIRESSESSLCGLMVRSMRCISSITAVIAASPLRAARHQSSTLIAVPMIDCSPLSQAPAAEDRPKRPSTGASRESAFELASTTALSSGWRVPATNGYECRLAPPTQATCLCSKASWCVKKRHYWSSSGGATRRSIERCDDFSRSCVQMLHVCPEATAADGGRGASPIRFKWCRASRRRSRSGSRPRSRRPRARAAAT